MRRTFPFFKKVTVVDIFSVYFFRGLQGVGHSCAYAAHFVFLRELLKFVLLGKSFALPAENAV
jgi:hypothetical protein